VFREICRDWRCLRLIFQSLSKRPFKKGPTNKKNLVRFTKGYNYIKRETLTDVTFTMSIWKGQPAFWLSKPIVSDNEKGNHTKKLEDYHLNFSCVSARDKVSYRFIEHRDVKPWILAKQASTLPIYTLQRASHRAALPLYTLMLLVYMRTTSNQLYHQINLSNVYNIGVYLGPPSRDCTRGMSYSRCIEVKGTMLFKKTRISHFQALTILARA